MVAHYLRTRLNRLDVGMTFTARLIEWVAFPSYGITYKKTQFGWERPKRLFEIIEVNSRAGTMTVKRVA